MSRYEPDAAVLAHVATVLERVVIPAVGDAAARGQAWAALGLLDNLAARFAAPPDALLRELDELRALTAAIPRSLGGVPEDPRAQEAPETERHRLAAAMSEALARGAGAGTLDDDAAHWMVSAGRLLLASEQAQMLLTRPTHYFRALRG